MLREKPQEEEWNDLLELKIPLLLNLAQCRYVMDPTIVRGEKNVIGRGRG